MDIKITFDPGQTPYDLQAIARLLEQPTQPLREVGEHLVNRVDDTFRKQEDPYGGRWAPLSAATIKAKRKRGGIQKILQDTGRMRATANYRVQGSVLQVGLSDRKAAFHQYGTRRMPARPILPDRGLPEEDTQEIQEIFTNWLGRALRQ